MLCDVCKQNEAKVHLTEIADGKTRKVDLCEECSREKGVENNPSFALADLLLGLGAAQEIAQSSAGTTTRCATCGFTQAEFKKSGRLGCPDCYVTFAEGLEGLFKSMHKGTRHVGKAPQRLREARDFAQKLDRLEKRMDKAVTEEDFEKAATLRDEIKQMKDRLNELAQG